LPIAAVIAAAAALPMPRASAQAGPTVVVFSGEGNRLNAYDAATGQKQTVIRSHADDAKAGKDINAQICFFPDGSRRFIAGEDTAQGTAAGGPGWGIFQLRGERVGAFSATQVGKLIPTFQTSDVASERGPLEDNPENYGCGFLSDGRVVTSDVGNQQPITPNNGQLIIWFPPFDTYAVKYCKLDVEVPTAGGIHVDKQDRVYLTANRPGVPDVSRLSGVYRYTGPFPTSNTAAGGCGSTDGTGAPLASNVNRSLFIPFDPINAATPSAIVPSPAGGFYVSSVFTGTISEYDAEGGFVRSIMRPTEPPVAGLPYPSTGTPYGIGVTPDGTIWYADLGVVLGPPPGPGNNNGTVRRIRFVDGAPRAPDIVDRGLAFPDGIGVLVLPAATSAARPAPTVPVAVLAVSGGAGPLLFIGLVTLTAAMVLRRRRLRG
jgi:hypothetical protein